MTPEAKYQSTLIQKLKRRFPGCIVLMNDASYQQGIPDVTILYGLRWAMLEVKPSLRARRQPNQEYYVRQLNDLSFAAFICPENEEEVLDALQEALGSPGRTRVSQS